MARTKMTAQKHGPSARERADAPGYSVGRKKSTSAQNAKSYVAPLQRPLKKKRRVRRRSGGITALESVSTGFNPANEASFQKMRNRVQRTKSKARKAAAVDRGIKRDNAALFRKEKAAAKRAAKRAAAGPKLPKVKSYKPPKPKAKSVTEKLRSCLRKKEGYKERIRNLANFSTV